MVAKDFRVGDLIWAKMKGFPFWPGLIIEPPSDAKSRIQKKPQHYVQFFGADNYAWILEENIVPHDDNMVQNANKKKSKAYQRAVEAIVNAQKKKDVRKKVEKISPKNETSNFVKSVTKKRKVVKYVSVMKESRRVQRVTIKKRPLYLICFDTDVSESSASCPKSQRGKCVYADFSDLSYAHASAISLSNSYMSPEVFSPPAYIEQHILDLSHISEALQNREIVVCNKKIGFLGLGIMGKGMVKNLLNSGHHVTIWNRTAGKMNKFLKYGASEGQTPADVVRASDITFCCVSDSEAVKSIVYEDCGVLKGFESCSGSIKGYVEMTAIDPETSQVIAEEITLRRGRYLEAPVSGSKKHATEGTLLFIAAGDRTLFEECETCFDAMGKDAHYMSFEVGTATKLSIAYSTLHSTLTVAIAEAMALMKSCKLSQSDFFEVFQLGALNCEALREKIHAILHQDYSTNIRLKHAQRILNLGLMLGDSTSLPMPIAAAAHEAYKTAKSHNYGDHDVSAVYQGIGF